MTEPLYIVGSGGFARETAAAVAAVNEQRPTWDLRGFLDDNSELFGQVVSGVPVIGPPDLSRDEDDARVVVCTGNPYNYFSRKRIVDRLGLELERYASVVHPAASIASSVSIGGGSVLLAGVVATADADIGAHVSVMPHVTITHDDEIESFCTLAAGAGLAGGVVLRTGAYLGAGAMINAGLSVGAWSLVGMGAVVLHEIPAFEVWAGVPARRLRAVEAPSDIAG